MSLGVGYTISPLESRILFSLKNVENPNINMWKSVKQKGSWPAIDVIYWNMPKLIRLLTFNTDWENLTKPIKIKGKIRVRLVGL